MEIIIGLAIIVIGVAVFFNRKAKVEETTSNVEPEQTPVVVEAPVAKIKVTKTKVGYEKVSRAKKAPLTDVAPTKKAPAKPRKPKV